MGLTTTEREKGCVECHRKIFKGERVWQRDDLSWHRACKERKEQLTAKDLMPPNE
jgi:hypothetical protein